MTFPRAVEQRIDVRERLDRRPRDGVEAPLVVADEPRTVWLASEHHISRVTRRRVLDPAAIEQVDVIAPQPPRARHQKAAWERTYPSKTESESSGAVGYTSCTRRVSLLRAQWTARTVPVSYESGGFRGRQREVTSAADPSHFAVADVLEGGGGVGETGPGPAHSRADTTRRAAPAAAGTRTWCPSRTPKYFLPPSPSSFRSYGAGWVNLPELPALPDPPSLPPSLSCHIRCLCLCPPASTPLCLAGSRAHVAVLDGDPPFPEAVFRKRHTQSKRCGCTCRKVGLLI